MNSSASGYNNNSSVSQQQEHYVLLHAQQAIRVFRVSKSCRARVWYGNIFFVPARLWLPFGCEIHPTPHRPSPPFLPFLAVLRCCSTRTMCVTCTRTTLLLACWLTCVFFFSVTYACLHLPTACCWCVISAFKATSCAATSATSAPCSRSSC